MKDVIRKAGSGEIMTRPPSIAANNPHRKSNNQSDAGGTVRARSERREMRSISGRKGFRSVITTVITAPNEWTKRNKKTFKSTMDLHCKYSRPINYGQTERLEKEHDNVTTTKSFRNYSRVYG